jgi:hypothetical protein
MISSIVTEKQPDKNTIMEQIQQGNAEYVFNGCCRIQDGVIVFSYSFFKSFATEQTYSIITQVLTNKLDALLEEVGHFIVYLNI